jgi:hypothetical protein
LQKVSLPWEHFIIESFLERSTFERIQRDLLRQPPSFKTLPEDPEEIQFTALPNLELTRLLLSGDFKLFLENLVGEKLRIYEKGALQLRRMTELSPEFPPHVDFIDERALIMLFYLSPGWSPQKGGQLLLMESEQAHPEQSSTRWIAPQENRMVLFFNDNHHWHSVRRVHDWNRYMVMAEWIVN